MPLGPGVGTPCLVSAPSPQKMWSLHWVPGEPEGSVIVNEATWTLERATPAVPLIVGPGWAVIPLASKSRFSRTSTDVFAIDCRLRPLPRCGILNSIMNQSLKLGTRRGVAIWCARDVLGRASASVLPTPAREVCGPAASRSVPQLAEPQQGQCPGEEV